MKETKEKSAFLRDVEEALEPVREKWSNIEGVGLLATAMHVKIKGEDIGFGDGFVFMLGEELALVHALDLLLEHEHISDMHRAILINRIQQKFGGE